MDFFNETLVALYSILIDSNVLFEYALFPCPLGRGEIKSKRIFYELIGFNFEQY